MSSFLVLYTGEIKKITAKKAVWIAMAIGLALVLLVGVTNLSADGHRAYVRIQEETLTALSGRKIDQNFLDEYQRRVREEIEQNWDKYEKISAYDPGAMFMNASDAIGEKALFELIYTVVRDRQEVEHVTEKDFYDKMREDIQKDGKEMGTSDEELAAWMEIYDTVDKPIAYSYASAYQNILDVLFIVGWALILNIAVALAGVFADEKTFRTDALILAARKGRLPICCAKILASITVAIGEAVLLLGGCMGVMIFFYGTMGWNSMIQNVIPSSPWNITIGTMMLLYFGLAAVMSIFFAMTNLLISHLTHSAVATMAIHAAIIFAGLFNLPSNWGLLTKLWEIRPTMPLYYGTFCNTFRYGSMNCVEASFLLYGTCIVLFLVILLLAYRKAQVESR